MTVPGQAFLQLQGFLPVLLLQGQVNLQLEGLPRVGQGTGIAFGLLRTLLLQQHRNQQLLQARILEFAGTQGLFDTPVLAELGQQLNILQQLRFLQGRGIDSIDEGARLVLSPLLQPGAGEVQFQLRRSLSTGQFDHRIGATQVQVGLGEQTLARGVELVAKQVQDIDHGLVITLAELREGKNQGRLHIVGAGLCQALDILDRGVEIPGLEILKRILHGHIATALVVLEEGVVDGLGLGKLVLRDIVLDLKFHRLDLARRDHIGLVGQALLDQGTIGLLMALHQEQGLGKDQPVVGLDGLVPGLLIELDQFRVLSVGKQQTQVFAARFRQVERLKARDGLLAIAALAIVDLSLVEISPGLREAAPDASELLLSILQLADGDQAAQAQFRTIAAGAAELDGLVDGLQGIHRVAQFQIDLCQFAIYSRVLRGLLLLLLQGRQGQGIGAIVGIEAGQLQVVDFFGRRFGAAPQKQGQGKKHQSQGQACKHGME